MAYRDIFYRCWWKERQSMHKVEELVWSDDGEGRWVKFGDHLLDPTRVELMEYIGHQDKNGDKIFEGDIVKIHWTGSTTTFDIPEYQIKEVKWDSRNNRWMFGDWFADFVHVGKAEIIGNIYQNKELLDTIK